MVQPPVAVQVTVPPFSDARTYRVRPSPLTRTVPSPGILAALTVTAELFAPAAVVGDAAAAGGVDVLVDELQAANTRDAAAAAAIGKVRARCRMGSEFIITYTSASQTGIGFAAGSEPGAAGARRLGCRCARGGSTRLRRRVLGVSPAARPAGRRAQAQHGHESKWGYPLDQFCSGHCIILLIIGDRSSKAATKHPAASATERAWRMPRIERSWRAGVPLRAPAQRCSR